MKRKRFTEEQISAIREEHGAGVRIPGLCASTAFPAPCRSPGWPMTMWHGVRPYRRFEPVIFRVKANLFSSVWYILIERIPSLKLHESEFM